MHFINAKIVINRILFYHSFYHLLFLEIFKEFSEEPVAAASLAQVFKAKTQELILSLSNFILKLEFTTYFSTYGF